GQDAAPPDDGSADLLHHVSAALPDGSGHLLGDDEPVDRRPGSSHTAVDPEDACGRAAAPLFADAAEGGAGRGRCRGARARNSPRCCSLATTASQAQEASEALTEQLQIEAT